MFEAENIRDWRLHDVLDEDGKKIGKLEAVYVDTRTDEPISARFWNVPGFASR